LPPNRIKQTLLELMRSVPGILEQPIPSVAIVECAGDAVVYRLGFTVARQEDLASARDTLLTRAWYVARRARLDIPGQPPRAEDSVVPFELLKEFPLFGNGGSSAVDIAPALQFLPFGAGENLVAEKGPLLGLYLVVKGEAVLTVRDRSGDVHQLGRVGRGDFFGENAMVAGQPSDVTVTALEDTDVLIIEPAALQKLLEQSPRLVHAIGHVLESRRTALQSVRSLKRPLPAPSADAA